MEELDPSKYPESMKRVQSMRLCEKDWAKLAKLNTQIMKRKRSSEEDLIAWSLSWIKSEFGNGTLTLVNREAPGERIYKIEFDSKASKKTEHVYIAFDLSGEHPPALFPPGTMLEAQIDNAS
jgi:hypothetical protein